jgi:hypothetical protein
MKEKWMMPSRKWWVTQITALTALMIAWINAGMWDRTLSIALVGLISQAAVGYLTPNSASAQPQQAAAGSVPAPATAGS